MLAWSAAVTLHILAKFMPQPRRAIQRMATGKSIAGLPEDDVSVSWLGIRVFRSVMVSAILGPAEAKKERERQGLFRQTFDKNSPVDFMNGKRLAARMAASICLLHVPLQIVAWTRSPMRQGSESAAPVAAAGEQSWKRRPEAIAMAMKKLAILAVAGPREGSQR